MGFKVYPLVETAYLEEAAADDPLETSKRHSANKDIHTESSVVVSSVSVRRKAERFKSFLVRDQEQQRKVQHQNG